jgi:integral membrane sensor domain MASE1
MGTSRANHLDDRHRLIAGLIGATVMSIGVIVSSWSDDTDLGAPEVWPWLLTGLQVLALWSAGRRWWWGWLLGGMVQFPWIAYALLTEQIGFIPGCAISATVQIAAFLRDSLLTTERAELRAPLQEATT